MRTTLILEDTVFEKAKRKAAEIGISLSDLTSLALKTLLMNQAKDIKKKPHLTIPTFGEKGLNIDYTSEKLALLRDEGR